MQDFANRLNSSSWQGVISEAGMGLEFSSRFLRVPGASQTVIGVNCDYAGLDRPHGMRGVSLDNAGFLAKCNHIRAKENLSEYEPPQSRFGFAITGAHYRDRKSHGWMYLVTDEWEAYMHFALSGVRFNRTRLGDRVACLAQWFLDGCLLSTESWASKLSRVNADLNFARIDVLYAPGISDFERLLLLSEDTALVYHKGLFHRVTDYLRRYEVIYPGAFNPPTRKHIEAGELFEISQGHCYKGSMDIEDLLHRVRMLDLEGKPTLITQAPIFWQKHKLIRSYVPSDDYHWSFLVGADAWNATIAAHQYPSHKWLGKELTHAGFYIMPRDNEVITETPVSAHLNFRVLDPERFENHNSTAVREAIFPGEHSFLTNSIAKYIVTHRLYGERVADSDIRNMNDVSSTFRALKVDNAAAGGVEWQIRDFVEDRMSRNKTFGRQAGGVYGVGLAYYQLTKPEDVQPAKDLVVRDKSSGAIYGGHEARALIGMPTSARVRVKPGNFGNWDIFIKSTSVNRKLVRGTDVLYRIK